MDENYFLERGQEEIIEYERSGEYGMDICYFCLEQISTNFSHNPQPLVKDEDTKLEEVSTNHRCCAFCNGFVMAARFELAKVPNIDPFALAMWKDKKVDFIRNSLSFAKRVDSLPFGKN